MNIVCAADKHLSQAEQAAVDYINKKQGIISLLSISDIADGAFVSNATVSRAIRKCGFKSLSEMKFRLAQAETEDEESYKVNEILQKSYVEVLETIKGIDIEAILRIAALLKQAKKIYILANGVTSLVADEFAFQLQCQRMNVCVFSDSQMMRRMDLLAQPEDLVIILSVKNSGPGLVEGARMARQAGAKVVVCCCQQGTALDGVSDIQVYGTAQSITTNRLFDCISRISLFIITRTIVEYLLTSEEGPGES